MFWLSTLSPAPPPPPAHCALSLLASVLYFTYIKHEPSQDIKTFALNVPQAVP